MAEAQPLSAGTQAAINFASGGIAGFVEVCIMHPVDLVKTRYQVFPDTRAGVLAVFRDIYRTEGLLSYYKGILPPLLAETPKRAVKFVTFEEYKRSLRSLQLPAATVYAGAGFLSGFTEAFIINPFERVKVIMQSQRQRFAEQASTWATARSIVRSHGLGLRGLNLGLTATIGRHSVFNCVYFGVYFTGVDATPALDGGYDVGRRFCIGFLAGTVASCINIPFDVAKSRIQGPLGGCDAKYRACWQTVRLVYREEGWLSLYRGLVPKILRLGPGGAILLLVYEFASTRLRQLATVAS